MAGRIASFRLGSTTLIQPIVTFSAATAGSEADRSYDAVLGGEMLRRCRLTLNYARREMVLEPNVAFSEPYEDDVSGATLSAQEPDLRQVLVQTVAADSPASQAGLKPMDLVESIDGRASTDLGLQGLKQKLRKDAKEVTLVEKRGDQSLRLVIKLRRMV